jgi:hypothetical protein
METLTQVQEAAIFYFNTRKRPNDHRAVRKAARMVRAYCEKQGYKAEEIPQLIRDMFDVARLERDAG